MWNVEIGKTATRCCSAVLYRELDEGYSISRNSESYWISERFLDIGARIFRGTPEYDRLHAMLQDVTITNEIIREWIDKLILRRATIQQLQSAINNQIRSAYREGRRHAKAEVRAVLMDD